MDPAHDADGPSPVPTEPYLRSVEQLLGLLLEDTPSADVLDQVLELTGHAVEPADAVAVTVRRADGRTDTAAASDAAVRHLDEVQREHGAGPCVEALASGEERASPDLRTDPRWPRLAIDAERAGLLAVHAVPLSAGGQPVGALNVYSRRPGGIHDAAVATMRSFAAPVAATLANALAYRRAERLGEQLQEAIASRTVIEQAKGILMVRAGVDEAGAFDLLRRTSQHQNRKLRDVAASVVAMRGRLPTRE